MGGIFMQIRESAEDYLEAILVLSKKGGGNFTSMHYIVFFYWYHHLSLQEVLALA